MPPKFYKHKLLLDEWLFKRQSLPRINGRYNLKHIEHDLHHGGITDLEVYRIACSQKRIIITYNIKHFREIAIKSKNSGVIGIVQGVTPDQLDSKLNSLLSRSSEKSFYGKYTQLNDSE